MRRAPLLMAALAISGCAALDRAYDEARWVYDGMETATYTWKVVDDPAPCGIHYTRGEAWGCAVRVMGAVPQPGAKPVPGTTGKGGHAFIYSNVSEDDAKRIISRHGDDLWSHELRHASGWVHPR